MPRETRLMLLSMFCGSFPIGILLVLFPLYLHGLGMRAVLIGGIFTGAGIGSSVLLMAIGPLADRFGRRRFLIAGTAVPALGFLTFCLTTDPRWLVLASMLGGVGFSGGLGGGLVTATFNPVLAGTVPPRLRTLALSWSEGAWAVSMGVGSLLAGLPTLLAHAGIMPIMTADRALFALCLASSLLATLLLLPVHEHQHVVEHYAPTGTARGGDARRSSIPLIIKLAVFFTLQGAALGLVVQLLPLWFALRFHTTAASIAPWFAVSQMAGIPLLALVPALARRMGVAGVIVLVAGVSTLFLVGLPLAPVLPLAGIAFICRSALVSMQWPAQLSFLQGAVQPRVRGTVTSVTMGCWAVASALMPTLTGHWLDTHQLLLPIWLGIGCYAAAAAWFWLTLRQTRLPEEAAPNTHPLALEATARAG